ncbi:MAG: hypothetical protein KDA85_02870 [Planctomycetaceae bacterium]|nr:hypothetical protein [Planctomycetaceae bacterium]
MNPLVWLLRCLSGVLWVLAISATSIAQQDDVRVVDRIWGFDGTVAPGHFNPVSLELDNLSDEPVEGTLELSLGVTRFGRNSGRHVQQDLFLAPRARRWVQFYPYITRDDTDWVLRLQLSSGRTVILAELETPQLAMQPPSLTQPDSTSDSFHVVSVILDSSRMLERQPVTVRHFREEVFPPFAPALSSLRVVLMDHVPQWETPRQEAFVTWLQSGGEVHLLQDSNGVRPRFSGALAELNEPFARFHVGMGNVTVHEFPREGVTKEMMSGIERSLFQRMISVEPTTGANRVDHVTRDAWSIDDFLFRGLRAVTEPRHRWVLLMFLSFVYIGAVFPGCWMLTRSDKLHYLTAYGALIGLSVVFSALFLLVGRRGYDEQTTLTSIGILRFRDSTHGNLFQWNSLFVTDGAEYQLSADRQQVLFALPDVNEAGNAEFHTGSQGKAVSLIPPYSAQTVLSSREVTVPDWELQITSLELAAESLSLLKLNTGKAFPADDELTIFAMHRNRLYPMRHRDGQLTISGGPRMLTTLTFEDWRDVDLFSTTSNTGRDRSVERNREFYATSLRNLLVRTILDSGHNDVRTFALPADRVRLLVYAKSPPALALQVNTEPATGGRVLYVRDILLNGANAAL